jgi:hypothetical protein
MNERCVSIFPPPIALNGCDEIDNHEKTGGIKKMELNPY